MIRNVSLLAAIALVLTGCLSSNPPVPTVYHRVDIEYDIPAASEFDNEAPSIAIRSLRAIRARGTAITYVDADGSEHIYPSVAWSEPPEVSMTRALIEKLLSTGEFSDVGLAGDTTTPDFLIQGEITAFREDRTDEGAVATVSLTLDVRERDSGRLAHYGVFTHTTPVSGGNVAELDAALEESARAVLEDVYAAIDGAIDNLE